jgi:hypothetical protein
MGTAMSVAGEWNGARGDELDFECDRIWAVKMERSESGRRGL